MEDDKQKLVKILYIVPDGEEDAGSGEGLWAFSLGEQLYQLQNVSLYAEHLNVDDVVFCDERVETIPVIHHLVRRSGNRTLRVIFQEDPPAEDMVDLVFKPLLEKGIGFEKWAQTHFVFNVPPDADYDWARDLLKQKDNEGLLWLYEQEI